MSTVKKRTTSRPRPPGILLLAGAALLSGSGCAGESEVSEQEYAVPGCYQFEQVEGDPALGLPWGVEFLDEPLEGWPALSDAFVARTWLTSDQVADHPFGYWTPVEGDSIRTGYPAGGGFDVRLAAPDEDGDLAGWGRAVGDAVAPDARPGPPPTRPVVARRVSCPTS